MHRKLKLTSGLSHLRRCHMCGCVSESQGGLVLLCGHCGKVLAPFCFFDDFETPAFGAESLRTPLLAGGDAPVRGLTATW